MTKNLGTADLLTKLMLSLLTILAYFLDMITGPFAEVLLLLAFVVLILVAVKAAAGNK